MTGMVEPTPTVSLKVLLNLIYLPSFHIVSKSEEAHNMGHLKVMDGLMSKPISENEVSHND